MSQDDMRTLPLWGEMHHICVVVRDFERVKKYYESFGIGPWAPTGFEVVSRKYLGKSVENIKIKSMLADAIPIRIELIQPVTGTSPWSDFLDKRGEGVMHSCFLVDDIEKTRADIIGRGLDVIYESRFKNGGGALYVSFDRNGGMMLELLQLPGNIKSPGSRR